MLGGPGFVWLFDKMEVKLVGVGTHREYFSPSVKGLISILQGPHSLQVMPLFLFSWKMRTLFPLTRFCHSEKWHPFHSGAAVSLRQAGS